MRILPGIPSDGRVTFPVEIVLRDPAITYWRWPGAAGVPPRFGSPQSRNVAGLTVAFPAPTRLREADTEVLGYLHRVVLSVTVTAWDPGAPGTLRLSLDYSTCERLCVPAHADLVADFPASSAQAVAASTATPTSPPFVAVPDDEVAFPGTIRATGASTWRIDVPQDSGIEDVFAGSDDADAWTTRVGPLSYDLRVDGVRRGTRITIVADGVRPRSWTLLVPSP